MKKLFYIVLVIVILMVAARLLKQENASVPAQETVTTEENLPVEINAEAVENADGQIAEGEEEEEISAEEVVEENPEETANEGETIVKD